MMLQLGDDGVVSSVNEEDLVYVNEKELDELFERYGELEKENKQLKKRLDKVFQELYCKDRKLEKLGEDIGCCDKKLKGDDVE